MWPRTAARCLRYSSPEETSESAAGLGIAAVHTASTASPSGASVAVSVCFAASHCQFGPIATNDFAAAVAQLAADQIQRLATA